MSYTVLIVESDPATQLSLASIVATCDYSPLITSSGQDALRLAKAENPAMMLLALILPDMDGFDVTRQLRKDSSLPLLVVTSRTSDVDRICAFELGADDYVTKPFREAELSCRIRSLMRTTYSSTGTGRIGPSMQFGELVLKPDSREVWLEGNQVHLTPKEFDLLLALAENHDRVTTSEWLLLNIWGYDENIRTRTLDVHINRLRSKIERDTSEPAFIRTITGVGYTFTAPLAPAVEEPLRKAA